MSYFKDEKQLQFELIQHKLNITRTKLKVTRTKSENLYFSWIANKTVMLKRGRNWIERLKNILKFL